MPDFLLALVTGAAHRLGRAFALALARQGYALLIHYHHSVDEAQRTKAEIEAIGARAFLGQADLTDPAQIESLFSTLDSLHYPLRLLVNSAAIMPRRAAALSSADWDATFALNLRAPFLCAQQAARRMDSGLIVNVTDVGAARAWSGFPAYAVSKAALESLTRVLASAYAPKIRVNAIAPGLVWPSENVAPEEWARLVDRLPLRRPASVDEIAAALEFLLKNEYITGQTIVVDGGYSLL